MPKLGINSMYKCNVTQHNVGRLQILTTKEEGGCLSVLCRAAWDSVVFLDVCTGVWKETSSYILVGGESVDAIFEV
jgi:hypothetical protein